MAHHKKSVLVYVIINSLTGKEPHCFVCELFGAVSVLIEIICPLNPKMFIVWPFTEKPCQIQVDLESHT